MTKGPAAAGNTIRCPGADIHFATCGEGTPLVLVHGWPLDSRIFTPQLAEFSRHFQVIVYDRRGFGLTRGQADMSRELDDLDALLGELTSEPVHLLGMSQGARIAIRYAVTRPHVLRTLVLQGAVIDGYQVDEPDHEQIPVQHYAELARTGRLDEIRNGWLQHPMMAEGQKDKKSRDLLRTILADYDGSDLKNHTPDHYHFPLDVLSALPGLQVPTLIITGAKETSTRKQHAAKLLQLLPAADEVIMPHSGHLSNLLEADQYNRVVTGFLLQHRG